MTAFASTDSAVSALRQGAYDYLTKPLDLDALRSTVHRALEHRAVVLENKRLMRFLQEQNTALEALHREELRNSEQLNQVNAIARQITAILDVETLLNTVIDLLKPAFDFASLDFGLVKEEALVFTGDRLDGRQEPLWESLFWRLTKGGGETFVRPRTAEAARAPYDLVFPLRAGTRVVGFWVANWQEDAVYRDENLPYLESLAAQTVTALDNARLYAVARQVDEMAFLGEVERAANRSLDLEDTIRSVLERVAGAFDSSLVEMTLLDEERRDLQVFSLAGTTFRKTSLPLLKGRLISRVRSSSPLILERAEVERMLGAKKNPLALSSLLGVSLRMGEGQSGILVVASATPGVYDLEDGRLLEVVGGQVSGAIENARLFQEVEHGRRTIMRSRDTLQTLFDGILDGICILDRHNTILAVNRTLADWAQKEDKELVGHPARLAFPTSTRALALIEETFRAGSPLSCTERQRTAQGTWIEWEIHTYPIVGVAESPVLAAAAGPGTEVQAPVEQDVERVVVVVRDVTEHRWLEASLAQSEKLAAIGRLAAGVAHEINNPMTVISANTQILREEILPSHPCYGSVRLIGRASERAAKVVRNLLDFSRVEAFDFVPTDLNLSLGDAVSLIEPQTRKTDIRVVVDLDADLPVVEASPDHLHVVWLNLLLNALYAIEKTGTGGEIHVTSRCKDGHVVVRITDDGVGMSPDVVRQVFDPFFTTKPPGEGTGLGLFTCYRTVRRHGGNINASSQVGEGTSFEIVLPVIQDAAREP
jgi:signal transduction histidine kinase